MPQGDLRMPGYLPTDWWDGDFLCESSELLKFLTLSLGGKVPSCRPRKRFRVPFFLPAGALFLPSPSQLPLVLRVLSIHGQTTGLKQGWFRASEVGSQGQEAVGASETPRHLALMASCSQDTIPWRPLPQPRNHPERQSSR